MSDTDSFIDEVTEEVRRDRLFGLMRRYGWIALLAVVALVGAAAYNEWSKARAQAAAEATGDAVLAALQQDDATARIDALTAAETETPGAQAVVRLLATAEAANEAPDQAASLLLALADDSAAPQVYRQIATLKAAMLPDSGLDLATRKARLEGLTGGTGQIRLLAEEQLALLAVEEGDIDGAIATLQAILNDAEVTQGLLRRASQVIVALGGEPEIAGADAVVATPAD